MHKKYAAKDFVAVSVSLDNSANPRARAKVESFLEQKGATFTNVILKADPADWQTRLGIDGPPCIYVFDRDNTWVKKLPELDAAGNTVDDARYTTVEKIVAQLLAK